MASNIFHFVFLVIFIVYFWFITYKSYWLNAQPYKNLCITFTNIVLIVIVSKKYHPKWIRWQSVNYKYCYCEMKSVFYWNYNSKVGEISSFLNTSESVVTEFLYLLFVHTSRFHFIFLLPFIILLPFYSQEFSRFQSDLSF